MSCQGGRAEPDRRETSAGLDRFGRWALYHDMRVRTMKTTVLAGWLFAGLLACGGGGGDGADGGAGGDGGQAADASRAPAQPQFGGVVLAYADGVDSISLHWLPATDDATPEADIVYEIYLATAASGDAPTDAPAVATVTGDTRANLTGLSTATEYLVTAIAVDTSNERSDTPPSVPVQTGATPLVANGTVVDLLGYSVTQSGTMGFFVDGLTTAEVAVGDIVLIPNDRGRILREVMSVSANGSGVDIVAERAAMSDVISSGELHMTGVLSALSGDGGEITALTGSTVKERSDPRGHIEALERTDGAVQMNLAPADEDEGSTTLEAGVTLDYSLGFEPSFEVSARWSDSFLDTPEHIRAVARGTFTVTADAAFDVTGSASYSAERELFERTYTFVYAVGGFPVVQDVSLKIMAELELAVDGDFHAGATFEASREVAIGFTYDADDGFEAIREDGFSQDVTFELNAQATASGTLKVYPVLSTSLYKAAEVRLFVVPTINVEAEARFLPLPVELEKFDVDFWVDGYIEADISAFGETIASWESTVYKLLYIPIHSLPEVELKEAPAQIDTCRDRLVFSMISDGYNNPVPEGNITWTLVSGDADLTPSPGGRTAVVDAHSEGTIEIELRAHGTGFLGVLGRRYATKILEVMDPPEGCDPDESTLLPPRRCQELPDFGLTDELTYSSNTIVPTEFHSVTIPYNTSQQAAGLRATWVHSNPYVSGEGFTIYEGPGHLPLLLDASESELTLTNAFARSNEGQWYPTLYFGPTVIVNGATFCAFYRDPFISMSTYTVRCHDADSFPTAECTEDSGIPIHYLRVVSADTGTDGNDHPSEAQDLNINGSAIYKHASRPGSGNLDFFTFEAPGAPPYDQDVGHTVGCAVEVELLDGYLGTVKIFDNPEDAAVDPFNFPPPGGAPKARTSIVDGQRYWVRVQSDVGPNTEPGYRISAVSECTTTPSLLATPTVDPTTVSIPGLVQVTLQFTPDTDRVDVQLWDPVADVARSNVRVALGVLGDGTATIDVPISAFEAASGAYVKVILRDPTFQLRTTYDLDASMSMTTYTALREDLVAAETVTEVTTLDLATLTIVD